MSITINSYSLSVDGLAISYLFDREINHVSYDPKSTCDLFEDLRIIDGWATDTNQEPVILFEREHDYEDEDGNIQWSTRTCHILWCDFVSSFGFVSRHAEIIVEQLESTKAHKSLIERINTLLIPVTQNTSFYSPLNAA